MAQHEEEILVEHVVRTFMRNPSESIEMNVDGSATPVEFSYTAPAGGHLSLLGISFTLMDINISPETFGDIDELSEGVLLRLKDGLEVVQLDMCDGYPIKRNADFYIIDSAAPSRLPGSNLSLLSISWIAQGDDRPIVLPAGWSASVVIRDDLTGLNSFRAFVKGRWVPSPGA